MKRSHWLGLMIAAALGALGAALAPAQAASGRAGGTTTRGTTTRAATSRGATTASQPATAKSPVYTGFVGRYMAGDWGTLVADMTAKQKEINPLPAAQKEDLNYIKAAIADCRPTWWDDVKTKNQKMPIVAKLWVAPMNLTFEPMQQPGMTFVQNNTPNSTTIQLNIGWPVDAMDNPEQIQASFTRGDAANEMVWGQLQAAELAAMLTPQKIQSFQAEQLTKFTRFKAYRVACTAAYYGMPRARRYELWQSSGSFSQNFDTDINMSAKRPLGSMLLAEWAANQAKYPSLKVPMDFTTLPREQSEAWLASFVSAQFLGHELTFDEDRRLRDAIKTFVTSNGVAPADAGKVTLPNKLEIALDPAKDADLAAKRYAWLWEKLTGKKDTKPARGTTTRATTTRVGA